MSWTRTSALLIAGALTLGGCSGGGGSSSTDNLPNGADLLKHSAEVMRGVETAHFNVNVDGTISIIPVRSADGKISRSGGVDGTAKLDQGGQLIEITLVITGGNLYFKGPTGGYQKLPASLAGTVYDPSAILDPDKGVAKLLSSAQNPATEAKEKVGGVDAYRIKATLDKEALTSLVPGVGDAVTGQLWIDAANSHLVQAKIPVGDKASATVTLSEFGAPVTITTPAG